MVGGTPEDREQIEAAVADLLDREGTDDERRGDPRIRFVRRGQVRWEEAPVDAAGTGAGPLPSAYPPGCEVVTIDISGRGVGIIAWNEIPKRDVVLELGGVRFLCKVLWDKAIGSQTWQYGLLFDKTLGPVERRRATAAEPSQDQERVSALRATEPRAAGRS